MIAAAALTILPEALRQFSNYRMLVYAIVLILVMLATNNPTLKGFFSRLFHRERRTRPCGGGERRRQAVSSIKRQETKLVPVPSVNKIPERDVDKSPILEAQHLGIDFGGLTAVNEFNMAIGRTGDRRPHRAPTARARPRCSTC